MSTYSYSMYEQERKRKEEERKNAPKKCPHCDAPINQNLSAYNSQVRSNCGAGACRSAAYRQRKADRIDAARKDADDRINRYAAQLPADQAAAVHAMRDVLMCNTQADYKKGHEQALAIIEVIESQRCKHDRISVLLDNASAAKRRADEAQQHNRELQAIYQHRITELENELSVYQLLEGAVHNIAQRQLAKQPDPQERTAPAQQPEPEPEDEDRRAVLATLARIGIKPTAQALAEEQQDEDEEDDTESNEDGEEYDGEDE